MAHFVDSIRLREVALGREERHVDARRVVVQVAMTAGNADARTGSDDARPGQVALVDQVAEVGGGERRAADIAHGRGASLEGPSGLYDGDHRLLRERRLELPDVLEMVGARRQVD